MSSRRQPELALPGGLHLRGWRAEDDAGLELALRDALVRRYAGFLIADRSEARQMAQRNAAAWGAGDGAAWVVADAGEQLLGSLRFAVVDRGLGSATVGYWLLPPARGVGAMTAAVRAGTLTVFRRFRWHRIELRHAVENERSCAVARRCGYRPEGRLREGMRYPSDGRWSDEHLHARLVSDPEPG